MSNEARQEMTLDEYVGQLHEGHTARVELAALRRWKAEAMAVMDERVSQHIRHLYDCVAERDDARAALGIVRSDYERVCALAGIRPRPYREHVVVPAQDLRGLLAEALAEVESLKSRTTA